MKTLRKGHGKVLVKVNKNNMGRELDIAGYKVDLAFCCIVLFKCQSMACCWSCLLLLMPLWQGNVFCSLSYLLCTEIITDNYRHRGYSITFQGQCEVKVALSVDRI